MTTSEINLNVMCEIHKTNNCRQWNGIA